MDVPKPLLLVSKLSIPPWRAHWAPRPRLLERVAQQAGVRLLLCSAPAGFGKTTALIACAEHWRAAGAMVAWYTLDPADNDLASFVTYLAGAFARADVLPWGDLDLVPPPPCAPAPLRPFSQALAELQALAGADVEQLLVGLLNLLGTLGRPAAIVLDDYHHIQASAVHQTLARLLDHLPANIQVAIGARADPPLPLARLRARGQLAELRANDLQFIPTEVAAFFQHFGLRGLPPDALTLLATWTEGWAAGLHLAALALPPLQSDGQVALEQLPAHVAGSQRHIFTFLADEVFAQQPQEVQAFLLATSIIDDLSPELCDALRQETGGNSSSPPPSAAILDQLEQAHLFLVRLDPVRPWYRYHHLFRDFLHSRLERDWPGRRAWLHRCAAGWYAATGEVIRAVDHALAAGDTAYAADLIVRVAWPQLTARGAILTLLTWAERFPDERLVGEPMLCLYFGRAAFLTQQFAMAEHFFALAEQGLARPGSSGADLAGARARLPIYRASVVSLAGEPARALSWLAAAEPLLAPEDPGTLGAHALAVGVAHYLRGDLAAASMAFARLGEVARDTRHSYLVAAEVQLLALVDLAAGRLARAEQRCTALLAGFGGELPAVPDLGLVLARLAMVAYHRGRLEHAEELLCQGAQVGRRSLGRADRQIWPGLVRVAIARGDQARLHALLTEGEGLHTADVDVVLAGQACAARAEGLLALGAVDEAWYWAQRCAGLPGEHVRDMETLALIRVLLARGRPDEALARLDSLLASIAAGGRVGHLIEGLVLKVMALTALQRLLEMTSVLRQARALGEPAGYVQLFAGMQDVGAPTKPAPLSREVSAPGPGSQPSALSPQPLLEALTEREHEVVRLLARGATNQEIADVLVVTVGTVKSHLNHILGKLGARNRTAAVARARDLGLL